MRKLPKKNYSLDKIKLKAYHQLTNEVLAELEELLDSDLDNIKLTSLIEKLSSFTSKNL